MFKLTLDVLVLIVILFIIGECRVTVVVETITQLGRIGVDGGIVIIAVCSPLRGDIALGLKASGNVGFLAEPVLVCIFRRVRSLAIGGRSRRHAPQVVPPAVGANGAEREHRVDIGWVPPGAWQLHSWLDDRAVAALDLP